MTRKEREENPGESFDGGYHLYAKEQFQRNNIEFTLKNAQSDDKLFQFWAGTGKIMGYDNARGIHALIKLLKR